MGQAEQQSNAELLRRLEQLAFEKTADINSLDELKVAAETSAALSAAKKTEMEAQNYSRQLRLEGTKSLSTLLIPVVSLLTLLATVLIQSYQLRETRGDNEDKQWRELLVAIRTIVKDDALDVTIVPRIKSFFGSSRYEAQAKQLSKRVLGQLSYEPGFRDLFDNIFGGTPALGEINDTVDIARTLRSTQNAMEARCVRASAEFTSRDDLPPTVKVHGLCSNVITDAEFSRFSAAHKVSEQIVDLRRSYLEVLNEQIFISNRIVSVIRENYLKGKSKDQKIDLSRVFLNGGNLSGVDLSNFDLSEAVLNFVTLDGALLTPFKGGGTLVISGSAWWKAERIDQDILKSLITSVYPYYGGPVTRYPDGEPARSFYVERIKVLCSPKQEFCEEKNLQFGQ